MMRLGGVAPTIDKAARRHLGYLLQRSICAVSAARRNGCHFIIACGDWQRGAEFAPA